MPVDEIWRAGREAWPEVALTPEALASELAGRDTDGAHAAELYLACACAAGAAGALAAFDRAFLSRLGEFVARMRLPPAFVDDLRQTLREKLFVGPAPKIREYGGQGGLANWLRVVAVRTALNLRRGRTELLDDGERSAASGPAAAVDVELDYIKERYRGELAVALRAALGALDDEQRNLLRLHFVEGLTLEQLAELFQVHRATVARRIAGAREAVLDEARRLLRERLDLDGDEFDSLVGLVRSRLDLTLPSFLRARTV